MKQTQRRNYADRIDRVIAALECEEFGNGAPTLEKLAGIAALSPHHFHRVFRLMTGETVGEALRRLRLSRSLPELAAGAGVTVASGASGYASTQAFARVLKDETGTSATRLRADPARLHRLLEDFRAPAQRTAGAPLAITVVSIDPFRLLAIRNVGDYAELNAGYGRLFELVLQQLSPEELQGIYGIPHDDPRFVPADQCRFDCALRVEQEGAATEELSELTLGGGEHLCLRHLGDYDRIQESIDLLYASVLSGQAHELADAPMFIHYLDDPEEVAEAELRADIYLPLA